MRCLNKKIFISMVFLFFSIYSFSQKDIIIGTKKYKIDSTEVSPWIGDDLKIPVVYEQKSPIYIFNQKDSTFCTIQKISQSTFTGLEIVKYIITYYSLQTPNRFEKIYSDAKYLNKPLFKN